MSTENTNKKDNISEQIESAAEGKEVLNEKEEMEEALKGSASSSASEEIKEKKEAENAMASAKQGSPDDSFQELPNNPPEVEKPEEKEEKNNSELFGGKDDESKTETESKIVEQEHDAKPLEDEQEPEAQENEPESDDNLEEDGFAASDLPDEAAEESEGDENALGLEPEQNPDEAMEEEAAEEDNKSAFKKFISSSWKRVLRDCVIVLLIVIFVYAFFYYHYGIGNMNNDSGANDEAVVLETETETEKITEAPVETEPVQPETVIQYVEVEAEPVETENWKDTIFGEESSSLLKNITITGLTSVQRDRTGFRETDFLQALSDFLDANNITGIAQVNFEEEIMCSSNGATAFRATLGGRPDKVLNVILYPDYPGRYILTLEDAQEVTVEVQTQAQTESSNQNQTQSSSTYSTQQGPTTTEEQQTAETSSTAETARAYDATTLSVIGIPDTLANYISNQYELQYTLYDYIYLNGYDADVAVVTDYYIDYDSRQAIIYFTLSDARMVTGTYSRDTNSYSYN